MPLMLVQPPSVLPRGYSSVRPFRPAAGSVLYSQSVRGLPMQYRYPTGIWIQW